MGRRLVEEKNKLQGKKKTIKKNKNKEGENERRKRSDSEISC
jgi:hypothetical protein